MINSGYTHENSIYQVNRISQSIPVNFEMENYADRGSTKKSRIIQAVVDLCIIIIVFIIFILVLFLVEPKTRHFSCDESDLFYPLLKDTVPFWAVGIFGIAGPIVIILGVEFLNGNFLWFQKDKSKRCRCFMISLYHSLSLFLMGVAIVLCLTEIGKRWIGRLRPHFMAVCKPDFSSFTCLSPAGSGFVPIQINTGGNFCTGDRKEVEEARLSKPCNYFILVTFHLSKFFKAFLRVMQAFHGTLCYSQLFIWKRDGC